jgi:hypothetical protein
VFKCDGPKAEQTMVVDITSKGVHCLCETHVHKSETTCQATKKSFEVQSAQEMVKEAEVPKGRGE